MPGRARLVQEGAADLVELLDELEPAQLEAALGRDEDGGERDVVVADAGVVVQEQQRLDDVAQAKADLD